MLYTGIYRRHGDCKCSQHNQTLEYQMSQLESYISWTVKIDIEFYPGNFFFRLLIVMHIEYSDERAKNMKLTEKCFSNLENGKKRRWIRMRKTDKTNELGRRRSALQHLLRLCAVCRKVSPLSFSLIELHPSLSSQRKVAASSAVVGFEKVKVFMKSRLECGRRKKEARITH